MNVLIESIHSPTGGYMAEILRRPDGLFQVLLMRRMVEAVPDYGTIDEYWTNVNPMTTVTDTVETARALGRELLMVHDPSSSVMPAQGVKE